MRDARLLTLISLASVMGVLTVACSKSAAKSLQAAAVVQTVRGPVEISKAARSQPCDADSCADRHLLSVTLPRGATYVATHYFSNAHVPDDLEDVYEIGAADTAWGRFSEAVHALNNQQQEVVTVYYYNRSSRDRKIAINVDYHP